METHVPKLGFRWILEIPGVPSFSIQDVESKPGGQLLITQYWLDKQEWPFEPSEKRGLMKFLDDQGQTTNSFELIFDSFETLPFSLDYRNGHGMSPKILLYGVKVVRL